jgi:hypothetical protein
VPAVATAGKEHPGEFECAYQQKVVDYLDREIDKRRDAATPDQWEKLYQSLMTETRPAIDSLLVDVIRDLKIDRAQEK